MRRPPFTDAGRRLRVTDADTLQRIADDAASALAYLDQGDTTSARAAISRAVAELEALAREEAKP